LVSPRPDQVNFSRAGEVFLEQLFHLRGEAGVIYREIDLPVGE
jgi:hypothetical protein